VKGILGKGKKGTIQTFSKEVKSEGNLRVLKYLSFIMQRLLGAGGGQRGSLKKKGAQLGEGMLGRVFSFWREAGKNYKKLLRGLDGRQKRTSRRIKRLYAPDRRGLEKKKKKKKKGKRKKKKKKRKKKNEKKKKKKDHQEKGSGVPVLGKKKKGPKKAGYISRGKGSPERQGKNGEEGID